MKATRVMRARKTSRCQLCHYLISVGQQIGKTPVGWVHTGCIIKAALAVTR